jgi:hypothetical protein
MTASTDGRLERLAQQVLAAWLAGRDPASTQPVTVKISPSAGLEAHEIVWTDGNPVQLPPRRVS